MNNLLTWLIGEAGAGWILGIFGLIGGIYTWLNREIQPHLIIQEIDSIRLLEIHESQANKVSVVYEANNKNVQGIRDLQQREFVIYNAGTKNILDPLQVEIKIYFEKEDEKIEFKEGVDDFYHISFDEDVIDARFIEKRLSLRESLALLSFKWINSYRKHNYFIRFYLISSLPLKVGLTRPYGRGWSSKYIGLIDQKELNKKAKKIIHKLVLSFSIASLIWSIYLMISNPIYLAFLQPSDNNIDSAVSIIRNRYELVGEYGYFKIGYYTSILKDNFKDPVYYLLFLIYFLLAYRLFIDKCVEMFVNWKLGIEPNKNFLRRE